MKTKLQKRLEGLYESRKERLGNNSKVLGLITQIAGNRGYSHEKRIAKIIGALDSVSLDQAERSYVYDMMETSYSHIRKTAGTSKKVRNIVGVARDIFDLKDKYEVVSGYKKFCLEHQASEGPKEEPRISQSESLYQVVPMPQQTQKPRRRFKRIIATAASLVLAAGICLGLDYKENQKPNPANQPPAATSKADFEENSPQKLEFSRSSDNKGEDLAKRFKDLQDEHKILADKYTTESQEFAKYQEQTSKELAEHEEKRTNLNEQLVSSERDANSSRTQAQKLTTQLARAGRPDDEVIRETAHPYISAVGDLTRQNQELKMKLARAGRPDDEVIRETARPYISAVGDLTRQNQKLKAQVQAYETQEAKKRSEEQRRLRESEQVYNLVSRLNLPEFPLARASVDPKTGILKDVFVVDYIPQHGFSLIDTPDELNRTAKAAERVFTFPVQDSKAYENFAAENKGDASLDSSTGVSALDRLVLFSKELGGRQLIGWGVKKDGTIIKNPDHNQMKDLVEVILVGSESAIRGLKGDKK